jgi:hypothetical protein
MIFNDKYTTNEKIAKEEADKSILVKTEVSKVVLSNDGFALGEAIENLTKRIRSLIK